MTTLVDIGLAFTGLRHLNARTYQLKYPGCPGSVCLILVTAAVQGLVSAINHYPEGVGRKVLDLVAAGRPDRPDRDISDRASYNWREQGRVDIGQLPGLGLLRVAAPSVVCTTCAPIRG